MGDVSSDTVWVLVLCAGLIGGIIGFGAGMDEGRSELMDNVTVAYDDGYNDGITQGYEDGSRDTISEIERSLFGSTEYNVMFRIDPRNNRSIGFAFPEQDTSFRCKISRLNEYQVGTFTYRYDNATCGVVQEDISETWDNASFENQHILDTVNRSEGSE